MLTAREVIKKLEEKNPEYVYKHRGSLAWKLWKWWSALMGDFHCRRPMERFVRYKKLTKKNRIVPEGDPEFPKDAIGERDIGHEVSVCLKCGCIYTHDISAGHRLTST